MRGNQVWLAPATSAVAHPPLFWTETVTAAMANWMHVAFAMALALPWMYVFLVIVAIVCLLVNWRLLCQIKQVCCMSALTTAGVCCDNGVVDDCGVCGGDNGCDFVVKLSLNVISSVGPTDPVFDVQTRAKAK